MNPSDIHDALIQSCKTTAISRDLTPILPGIEYGDLDLPTVSFDFIDASRSGGTLKGGEIKREIGGMVMLIDVVLGRATTESDGYGHAVALADLFPEGRRLSFTGGNLVIPNWPEIRRGFPDQRAWRTPVMIKYIAQAS